MKKFYLETYGCQMNFAQSSQLYQSLKKKGFDPVENYIDADIILINACSVRAHAENRVFQRINSLNSHKIKDKKRYLVVTGCFAQNNKEKINADLVIGSSRMSDIPGLLLEKTDKKFCNVEIDDFHFLHPVQEKQYPFRAMIDITKGCDNYCSYCIVPYVRGPQQSRDSSEIIFEVKKLVDSGVKEFILLGQNVNSYGADNNEIKFAELLYKINSQEGVERIKFLTSHPKDFTEDIIQAVFELEKVTPYIHLPIQSGSNKILKSMNRKYTREDYFQIVQQIQSYNQDYSISTDLLVGFPGENEDDFLKTISLVEKIGFNEAFTFKYSPRPYTTADKFEDNVPEEEKKKRLDHLIKVQRTIEKEKVKDQVNKNRRVLLEKESKKDKDKLLGRDELNYQVIVDESLPIGSFHDVFIYDSKATVLFGRRDKKSEAMKAQMSKMVSL